MAGCIRRWPGGVTAEGDGERHRRRIPGRLAATLAPALLAGALAAVVVQPGGAAEPALPVAAEPVLGGAPVFGSPRAEPGAKAKRARPAAPRWISIPSLGAEGPVDSVRARAGALTIPAPGRAGWFGAGPRPGEPGRAVIVSHVDSRQGPALFAGLRSLARGAKVLVRDGRGQVRRFRIVSRRQVAKSHFSAAQVYGGSLRRELVLITCGGPFSPGEGYRDNLILRAVLARPNLP